MTVIPHTVEECARMAEESSTLLARLAKGHCLVSCNCDLCWARKRLDEVRDALRRHVDNH